MRRVLCLHLPCWPIQRLVVANNELKRQRLVLYQHHAVHGQRVTAVSPAAQLSGVQVGMSLSEAQALLESRMVLQVSSQQKADCRSYTYPHDPQADLRALEGLALSCSWLSPIVGWEVAENPCSLLLEITRVSHLLGGEAVLEARARQYMHELGYVVETAIASTVGMAWGLARFGLRAEGTEPRGGVAEEQAIFEALPVAALRIPTLTVNLLQQLGVHQVGQLLQLPRTSLRSRFGAEVLQRLDQASGVIDEVIDAFLPPADFSAEQFLEHAVNDCETLQVILSRLLGRLCKEMRDQQRGALVWHCLLKGEDASPVELKLQLFHPTSSREHLMPLIQMQLERLFSEQGGAPRQAGWGVQTVEVSVRYVVVMVQRQRQLFDENPRLDKQVLANLVNRLSNRLGAEQVLAPRLQKETQVEHACYFEPMVGQNVSKRPRQGKSRAMPMAKRERPWQSTSVAARSPLERPLTVFETPLLLGVVVQHGRQERQPPLPTLFVDGARRWRVRRRWGPERMETAWWREGLVRRDYWRVETDGDQWLWVFYDLRRCAWYLHGEF